MRRSRRPRKRRGGASANAGLAENVCLHGGPAFLPGTPQQPFLKTSSSTQKKHAKRAQLQRPKRSRRFLRVGSFPMPAWRTSKRTRGRAPLRSAPAPCPSRWAVVRRLATLSHFLGPALHTVGRGRAKRERRAVAASPPPLRPRRGCCGSAFPSLRGGPNASATKGPAACRATALRAGGGLRPPRLPSSPSPRRRAGYGFEPARVQVVVRSTTRPMAPSPRRVGPGRTGGAHAK